VQPPDQPSPESGPPERAEAAWLSWRVHGAIERLPEHERPVIELAYWGGLSQSEIAEFLQIPLGTVKTRTRSALSRLADLLEPELPPEDRR
jgi:RNA polymerase sigma-70 factor (ECF subfamily)